LIFRLRKAQGVPVRRLLLLVGAAVAPWLWFVVRDLPLGTPGAVLAIGLPVLVAAVAVLAGTYALRGRGARRDAAGVLAVSTLLAGMVIVVEPWLPQDAGGVGSAGVTVVAANVGGRSAAAGVLTDAGADVVVLSEADERLVARLAPGFPYRYVRIEDTYGPDVAVLSRFPLQVLDPVGPTVPGARVRIEGPDGPFVLYGLHVPRPWPTGGADQVYQATPQEHRRVLERLAEQVRAEPGPVVVAGDLNSVDRERGYRMLLAAGLVDAMRDTPSGPTSMGPWLPLLARIDHVLVSAGWCGDGARRFALPGSSHRAVTATVGPCAGGGSGAARLR
jgi:endonuclease/exonuclease/phosphatase (EEP) superfamily protein YafD